MNATNQPQSIHTASVTKRALQGGGIALVLIALFLSGAKSDPAWPSLWMLRPLVIVPIAGAMGGVFYYLMDRFRHEGGWKKFLANVASLIVYLVGLWMGTIVGLDGTLWN